MRAFKSRDVAPVRIFFNAHPHDSTPTPKTRISLARIAEEQLLDTCDPAAHLVITPGGELRGPGTPYRVPGASPVYDRPSVMRLSGRLPPTANGLFSLSRRTAAR